MVKYAKITGSLDAAKVLYIQMIEDLAVRNKGFTFNELKFVKMVENFYRAMHLKKGYKSFDRFVVNYGNKLDDKINDRNYL